MGLSHCPWTLGGRLSAALGGVLALDSSCRAEAEQEGYVITRTSEAAGVACVRTAWTIGPPTDGAPVPEDGILRVGQKFSLSVRACLSRSALMCRAWLEP